LKQEGETMGVRLLNQRNGTLREHWYGVYHDGCRKKTVNLGVPWKGTPPESGSLRDPGDAAFERSREDAETELARQVDEARRKGRAEHLTQRLIESKTGRAVEYVRVADLSDRWRKTSLACEAHLAHTDATFTAFAAYVLRAQPDAAFCYAVSRRTVESYAAHLRAKPEEGGAQLAPATARRKLRLLKSAFARALPVGAANPFDPLPWKHGDGAGEEVHRRPLSPDELLRLLDTARRRNPFLFPLLTAAACSGLRRGDVCRLKWEAVDLAAGMLAVRTEKTGQRVEIPIFKPLREVLDAAQSKRAPGAVHVWPSAARMIESTPNLLTRMFKMLAAEAAGVLLCEPRPAAAPAAPRVELPTVRAAVETAVAAAVPEGERRDRILDNVRRYAEGQTVRGIEKVTGRPRGRVSEDLHTAERLAGVHFLPDMPRVAIRTEDAIATATRQTRQQGQRAASLVDWHCLRTTFVTLALSAGVPVETLQLVTGHRTVAVVLANYYRPQREHLRAALAGALPDLLTGGADTRTATPAEELAALAEKNKAGLATAADKKRLRLLAVKV
jgi:integrase